MDAPIATTLIDCVIEGQEIRQVTYDFPGGPVEGYEWRLRVTRHTSAGPQAEQLPWIFGSRQSVEKMLRQWDNYIRLTSMPPDSIAQ